jgi:hypothetical protein
MGGEVEEEAEKKFQRFFSILEFPINFGLKVVGGPLGVVGGAGHHLPLIAPQPPIPGFKILPRTIEILSPSDHTPCRHRLDQ